MSAHIATLALLNQLPKGKCHACSRHEVKKGYVICRQAEPLNGEDAALEFSRHLRPVVRAQVLGLERAYPAPARHDVAPLTDTTTEAEAA